MTWFSSQQQRNEPIPDFLTKDSIGTDFDTKFDNKIERIDRTDRYENIRYPQKQNFISISKGNFFSLLLLFASINCISFCFGFVTALTGFVKIPNEAPDSWAKESSAAINNSTNLIPPAKKIDKK
jgi:hypothetical protein